MSVCIIKTKTIEEITNAVNSSNSTKEVLNKLGYNISVNTNVDGNTKKILINICKENNINYSHLIKRKKILRTCKICGKNLCHNNTSGFCYNCYKKNNENEKIQTWLKTGKSGYAVSTTIRGVIRKYLYKEQNNKCAICGLDNKWNGQELKFILDHIDGNAANNERNNLRLICPNCDSQLPTYKSKNKNSARKFRNKEM